MTEPKCQGNLCLLLSPLQSQTTHSVCVRDAYLGHKGKKLLPKTIRQVLKGTMNTSIPPKGWLWAGKAYSRESWFSCGSHLPKFPSLDEVSFPGTWVDSRGLAMQRAVCKSRELLTAVTLWMVWAPWMCSSCKLTNTPDSDIECLPHGVISGSRDLSHICEPKAYEGI